MCYEYRNPDECFIVDMVVTCFMAGSGVEWSAVVDTLYILFREIFNNKHVH